VASTPSLNGYFPMTTQPNALQVLPLTVTAGVPLKVTDGDAV